MTPRLTFEVPGPIRGKGRPRFVRATGRAYTPADTMNAEAWVKQCALNAGATPLDGPLSLTVHVRVQIPQSWSAKKQREALGCHTTGKPDLDNIVKLIGDSLNGIAWADDKQVAAVWMTRRYAETPGATVIIEALT